MSKVRSAGRGSDGMKFVKKGVAVNSFTFVNLQFSIAATLPNFNVFILLKQFVSDSVLQHIHFHSGNRSCRTSLRQEAASGIAILSQLSLLTTLLRDSKQDVTGASLKGLPTPPQIQARSIPYQKSISKYQSRKIVGKT